MAGAWLAFLLALVAVARGKLPSVQELLSSDGLCDRVPVKLIKNGGGNDGKGEADAAVPLLLPLDLDVAVDDWAPLWSHASKLFGSKTELRLQDEYAPVTYALYSLSGRRLHSMRSVLRERKAVVVPSYAHFVWPAFEAGHVTEVELGDDCVEMHTLSSAPRVFFLPDLLSDEECDSLVATAEPHLREAMLYHPSAQRRQDTHVSRVRNSTNTFLRNLGPIDPVQARVLARLAAITHVPIDETETLSEGIQVGHYERGQHYRFHHDYLLRTHGLRTGTAGGRNRFITALIYLSDVDAGGETLFPLRDGDAELLSGLNPYNLTCPCEAHERGLRVRPRKGSAVLFYNLAADGHMAGALDPLTLHAGCTVDKGTKAVANVWIYNKPVQWHLFREQGSE